jgi:hypothetical protein
MKIVGGRPPGNGKEAEGVSRSIEILLKKAATDESFRKMFMSDRTQAAEAIGLTLNPVEANMLKAIPEPHLERMIAATKVQPKIRPAFMGYAATVMLAALTAGSDGISQNTVQGTQSGVARSQNPNSYGGGIGIAGSRGMTEQQWKEFDEKQIAYYKTLSYMKIAPRDESAPKGNLEAIIAKWDPTSLSTFIKVHLAKIESPAKTEGSLTEGVGYARMGRLLLENIPVGEYVVEIDFADELNQMHSDRALKSYLLRIKVIVKEKETATAIFDITAKPSEVILSR